MADLSSVGKMCGLRKVTSRRTKAVNSTMLKLSSWSGRRESHTVTCCRKWMRDCGMVQEEEYGREKKVHKAEEMAEKKYL